jgi:hypothetical protein
MRLGTIIANIVTALLIGVPLLLVLFLVFGGLFT